MSIRRRLFRIFGLLTLLVAASLATVAGWSWWMLHQPYRQHAGEMTFDVPPGQGAARILDRLQGAGILADHRLARAYLVWRLHDPPLKAGEYRFAEPLNTPQVLDRLIRGEVVTHPLTLIEGLDLDEIADVLGAAGFGDRAQFHRELANPSRIADLDPKAENLEGYVFPDTYHFARGTSPAAIVDTLVDTFRQRWAHVAPLLAAGRHSALGSSVREVVTLASVVEKEAGLDAERPMVAGVYANRLRRGIALYADPTVIYAIKLRGDWDGNLRKADLRYDSPYNTYVYPGLPPGPICSPGLASLQAAAQPADVPYLYFVSRNDGSHVFAEDLRQHNRNVEKWQRQYWRAKRAAERAKVPPTTQP